MTSAQQVASFDPLIRPAFVYPPLSDSKTHVRRLIIRSHDEDGTIFAELDAPWNPIRLLGYICLSYVWGDLSSNHEIEIGGSRLRVRNNLYDFLRHAVAPMGLVGLSLWVDAVCINQSDLFEKNDQVANMGEIYRFAAETIVWLGNDPSVCSAVQHVRACDWETLEMADIESLHTLCEHEYWQRTWITQEILLSRKIKIIAGSHTVDWLQIGAIFDRHTELFSTCTARTFWNKWKQMRQDRKGSLLPAKEITPLRDLSFWELFEWRKSTLCTDDRDRIYAMMSMTENRDTKFTFRVRYNEELIDIFCRTGDYFNIWCCSHRIQALMEGLRRTTSSLTSSLENNLEPCVSLRVTRIESQKRRTRLGISKPYCRNKHCQSTLFRTIDNASPRYEYVLCTHSIHATLGCIEQCVHILVRPYVSDGKQNGGLETKLLIPGYEDIDPNFFRTKSLEIKLYPTPYGSADGWTELWSWPKAQQYFNGEQTAFEKKIRARVDGFRFRISASFVLLMLQR